MNIHSKYIKYLSLILLVSLILNFCVYLFHFNDHHDESDCQICNAIVSLKKELDLTKGGISIIVVIISFMFIISSNIIIKLFDSRNNTLIGLRVKLLN